MSIPVECPACEHHFSVPDSCAGQRGKCPQCSNVFRAPESGTGADRIPVAAPPAPPSAPPVQHRINVGSTRSAGRVNSRPIPLEPPPQSVSVIEAPPVVEDAVPSVIDTPETLAPPVAESSSIRSNSPTAPPTNTKIWIAAAVGAVLFVGGSFAILAISAGGNDHQVAKNQTGQNRPQAKDGSTEENGSTSAAPTEAPLTKAVLDELWQTMRSSVCRVEATTSSDNIMQLKRSVGTGFVIDQRGWVATSYHVVRDADSVKVSIRVPDVSYLVTFDTDGVIAQDPAHDVAILAVDFEDAAPDPLTLSSTAVTKPGDELIACQQQAGSWLRITTTHEATLTESLPADCQAAVRERELDESQSMIWIRHDLPPQADDAGAPLLNRAGEVIGVAVSLDTENEKSFAIPVKYLAAMKSSAGGAISPLGSTGLLTGDAANAVEPSSDPIPDKPIPGTQESLGWMRELRAECEEIGWFPETPAEYGVLQQLAVYVVAAKETQDDPEIAEDLQILIGAGADEVMRVLRRHEWPEDELAQINSLAVEGLKKPGNGLFAYVELVLPTKESPAVDSTSTIVCRLIGTDQLVIIPVSIDHPQLTKDSRWLLMAVHEDPTDYPVLIDGKPDQVAALIRTKHLIGEPGSNAE